MEENINNSNLTHKIYSEKHIWFGTFMGGPLAAGYLIAENFKAFNETEKARNSWIIAIISTIVIFGAIYLIPDNIKIPNQIIPLTYTAIAYALIQKFQGENISKHKEAGGELFGFGRTFTVSIIGLILTLVPIISIALLSDTIDNNTLTTKTYGTMKHEIAFDPDNISDAEIDKIADGLKKTTFFDEAMTKYVVVKKMNERYEISISVVKGLEKDQEALIPFINLRKDMQSLFPANKIVLNLVVDNLDNVVKSIY